MTIAGLNEGPVVCGGTGRQVEFDKEGSPDMNRYPFRYIVVRVPEDATMSTVPTPLGMRHSIFDGLCMVVVHT